MRTLKPLFTVHGASLVVRVPSDWCKPPSKTKPWRSPVDWETYNRLLDILRGAGFSVGSDPRIDEHFPILSSWHNYGRFGDLEFKSEVYNTGMKIEFFQNINFENSNGGQYDFDKLEKMPYLVLQRWKWIMRKLREHLLGRGFTENVKVLSANPDPLAFFNSTWEAGRFVRDENGWPAESEINHWGRKDKDGVAVNQGDVRYFRNWGGRLMRGRVYGGINGMWMVVYGPGKRDHTHVQARELISDIEGLPRKLHPNSLTILERQLTKAIKEENFERAAKLRDLRNEKKECV